MAGAGEFVEFPGPVAPGAMPPRGVETLAARRVPPGGQALIEVRGKMTDQHRAQGLARILASQVGEQGEQRPLMAETAEHPLPQGGGSLRRGGIEGRGLGARRRVSGEHRRAQFACGGPEIGDRGSLVESVEAGGGQKALPRRRVEVGLQAPERRHLLALPAQAGRRDGLQRGQQCRAQDFAAAQAQGRGGEQPFLGAGLR